MSASSTGIPPQIEQQLRGIDKQVRDTAFIRGVGRFVFCVCFLLAASLFLDGIFDLNGTFRGCLLLGWTVSASILLWNGLIRPIFKPISFSALAALIEKQFPELRERLTSLVELRGDEGTELAPGASKLMQDLLARQTVKALDRLAVDNVQTTQGSFRALMFGAVALVLLFVPFGVIPDGYRLLWGRFFVPWGNYAWGASIDLKVDEGDQVVARGSDVSVHVSLIERRGPRGAGKDRASQLWLNWQDEKGISDSRRLEWDDARQQFMTTLPHVTHSLTFQVTTAGAKSGTYRVDVSDPPAISQIQLEIEPAAYTGLPAKLLKGVPGEVIVPESTSIQVRVEFVEPVVSAELKWPMLARDPLKPGAKSDQVPVIEESISMVLSGDHRTGVINAFASVTGPFVVRAKNQFGLQNNDPARTLVVTPDQPPQIKLVGRDEPVLVRPDDVFELPVEVRDDFGLTSIELHAETSTGIKHIESLPNEMLREPAVNHTFTLDLAPFELIGGQVVTYRVRAVDNRPHPNPQEVWTPPRMLMTNTSLKQLPDLEMASAEKSLEDELTNLRTELNETKADLTELHRKAEDESLNKQLDSDKSPQLDQLREAQDKLIERLDRLTNRLAAHEMTQDLAPQAQRIADGDLQAAQDSLEKSKEQAARDQLEPLAQAIDHLGAAERQLSQLEQQLTDLNKLEQELAELNRMAQRAERLADQLEKLESQKQSNPPVDKAADSKQASRENEKPQNERSSPPNETEGTKNETAKQADNQSTGVPDQLKDEGQKLTNQMNELLKKHPELLDAARRDQVDQLNNLAEQAKKLIEPQERLAQALEQAAAEAPAVASRPENTSASKTEPAENTKGDAPSGDAAHDASKKVDESQRSTQQTTPKETPRANSEPNSKPDQPSEPMSVPTSQQPAGNNPASEPGNDPSQKPADATKPSDPLDTSGKAERNGNNPESKPNPRTDIKEVESKPASDAPMKQTPGEASKLNSSDNSTSRQSPENSTKTADTPKSPTNDKPSSNSNIPANQNKDNQNNKPSDVTAPESKDSSESTSPQTKPSTPNEASSSQNAQRQQGAEAAKRQEQIAQQATQQAINLAKETGADSDATKAASEFARKADDAKQQAQSGQMASAAQRAKEAASAADETAKKLNPDGQSNSPQSQKAQQLADKQRETAQQLEKTAGSPDAAQGAQIQGQRQLSDATNRLAEQLDKTAKSLKAAPLNSQKDAEAGEQAKQAAKQAQQAMQQSEQANQQNDPQQAAKAAADAADKLKQAANTVKPTPQNSKNSTPVPKQIGTQVAEAMKRLDSAQKELSQCNCPKPGGSGQSTSPKPGEGSSSQPQNGQSQNPSNSNSEKNSSASLAQQAEQSQQPKPAGQNSQNGQPQNLNQPAAKPGQEKQGAKPAGQNPQNGQPQNQNQQAAKPGQEQQGAKPTGQNPQNGQAQSKNQQGQEMPNQSMEKGETNDGHAVGNQQGKSQIAQAVDQFREAAAMLRRARGEPKENLAPGEKMKAQRPGKSVPGESTAESEPGEGGSNASGTTASSNLIQLDEELQQQAKQNWGKLPGRLRTEILQGAGKKPYPEYTQKNKSYFDEITKPAK